MFNHILKAITRTQRRPVRSCTCASLEGFRTLSSVPTEQFGTRRNFRVSGGMRYDHIFPIIGQTLADKQ